MPEVVAARIPDPAEAKSLKLDILDAQPDEFVTFFSTTNEYRWLDEKQRLPRWAVAGSSRALDRTIVVYQAAMVIKFWLSVNGGTTAGSSTARVAHSSAKLFSNDLTAR
ncbi:hypothetical protein GGR58DRAFT_498567 [Xylaria digitata]|nr:hypothetical protein GGR58DRAFT_498567 [Xylaria digitata]